MTNKNHKAFNKLYTGKGDTGDTQLMGGKIVRKNSSVVNSYGEVDELNSHVGLLRAYLQDEKCPQHVQAHLRYIQHWLFDLGTDLSSSVDNPNYRTEEYYSELLEDFIDNYTYKTPPINKFVLPTGSKSSSQAHICRTVTRRVERAMYDIDMSHNYTGFKFINRLSDYFFALARYLNAFQDIDEDEYINPKKVYKSDKHTDN